MAATSYGVNHPLAVKAWAKKLFVETLKETRYAQFRGSSGTESLISMKNELTKDAGDRVRQGLRMQLSGAGIQGDATLEGNEEALATHHDDVFIDQLRHAVKSEGEMSEQRVSFDVRQEAMDGLRDWWADRWDTCFFNQLAGASVIQTQANTVQSTNLSTVYSGNQVAIAPDASHIFSSSATNDNTTEASLSATTTFALKLADIDRAVAKAKTLTPAIRPLKVNGDTRFVLFIHPYQTYQLRTNTADGNWLAMQRDAMQGGKIGDNPRITGLLGVYNNTMIVEDARVPNVPTITANTSYRRSVFCGAQAALMAFGRKSRDGTMTWVEEGFDYKNKLGVSAGAIFGIKKTVFNSADFSTIVISGYAPAA